MENIIVNNALIAKHMGYIYFESGVLIDNSDCGGIFDVIDVYSKTPIQVDAFDGGQKYFSDVPNPDYKNENNPHWNNELETLAWSTLNSANYIHDLKYHSSWDWLMPVVHKCCADLKEMGFDKRGSWNPEHGYASGIYVMRLDNPIEKVWHEVINHIKRFKKNG